MQGGNRTVVFTNLIGDFLQKFCMKNIWNDHAKEKKFVTWKRDGVCKIIICVEIKFGGI